MTEQTAAASAPEPELAYSHQDVRYLLSLYRQVANDVRNLPLVSITGFFIAYGKLVWWELNLFLLPLVGLVNGFIWLWNKLSNKNRRYLPIIAWRYLRDAASAFWHGDLPLLKFITLRFAVNLFVVWHVRSRLHQMRDALRDKEIEWALSNSPQNPEMKDVTDLKKILTKCDSAFRQKLVPAALILIAPYALGSIKLLFEQKTLLDYVKQFSWANQELRQIALYSFSLLLYTLLAVISSFVVKRELFAARSVYQKEYQVFTKLRWPYRYEFPLDLVGWLLFFTLGPLVELLLERRIVMQQFSSQMEVTLLAFSTPFMIALWRRRATRKTMRVEPSGREIIG